MVAIIKDYICIFFIIILICNNNYCFTQNSTAFFDLTQIKNSTQKKCVIIFANKIISYDNLNIISFKVSDEYIFPYNIIENSCTEHGKISKNTFYINNNVFNYFDTATFVLNTNNALHDVLCDNKKITTIIEFPSIIIGTSDSLIIYLLNKNFNPIYIDKAYFFFNIHNNPQILNSILQIIHYRDIFSVFLDLMTEKMYPSHQVGLV